MQIVYWFFYFYHKPNKSKAIAPGTFRHPTIKIVQTFTGILTFIYWPIKLKTNKNTIPNNIDFKNHLKYFNTITYIIICLKIFNYYLNIALSYILYTL